MAHPIRTGWARAALAATVVALAGWAVAPARAADYREIVLDGHTLKWGAPMAGSGATVTYADVASQRNFAGARNCPAVEPLDGLLAASHIARATFDQERDAAFAAWSAVANIRFVKVDGPDADILIGAEAQPLGRAFTNVEYAGQEAPPLASRAFTNGEHAYAGAMAERASLTRSVICLNPDEPWKVGFDGNLDVYDIRYALTHEIGHAIGLDHPGQTGELMDFRYGELFRVPQMGDIAGATFLYGPSVTLAARAGVVRKVNVQQ